MRIVINGFGRIGRTILRQILSQPRHDDIEVALINDVTSLETCAYLFQYDSTFGPYPSKVDVDNGHLTIGEARIPFTRTGRLDQMDFAGVDV